MANRDPMSYHERISIPEASELARVSLETSRRRRRWGERRRPWPVLIAVVLWALVVYLAAGGPAWPA